MPADRSVGRRVTPGQLVPAVLVVALTTIVVSILVPTVAIAAVSMVVGDSMRVHGIAMVVAEPLALLGAVLAVVVFATRRVRFLAPKHWAALVGAASALGVLTAAPWVNDVDRWAAAALVLLPAVAAMALRFTRPAA